MKDKPIVEIGKTFYPKERHSSDTEIVGSYWRVWLEGGKYFYECDMGHFATKFQVFEISEEDFVLVKLGRITSQDLTKKYAS